MFRFLLKVCQLIQSQYLTTLLVLSVIIVILFLPSFMSRSNVRFYILVVIYELRSKLLLLFSVLTHLKR